MAHSDWTAYSVFVAIAMLFSFSSCGSEDITSADSTKDSGENTTNDMEYKDRSQNLNTPIGRRLVKFVYTNENLFINDILLEQSKYNYKKEMLKALNNNEFNELTFNLMTFHKAFDSNKGKFYNEATFVVIIAGMDELFKATYFIHCAVTDTLIPKMVVGRKYRINGNFLISDTSAYNPSFLLSLNLEIPKMNYPDFTLDGDGFEQELMITDSEISLNLRSVFLSEPAKEDTGQGKSSSIERTPSKR